MAKVQYTRLYKYQYGQIAKLLFVKYHWAFVCLPSVANAPVSGCMHVVQEFGVFLEYSS